MSWWTNVRDATESLLSTTAYPIDYRGQSARRKTEGVTGWANDVRNKEEGLFNKLTGRRSELEKREQANQVNEQVKAYKEQTNLAKEELNTVRNQKNAEKRRINEKQVRSLRSHYRAPGLTQYVQGLGESGELEGGLNRNLGG